MCYKFTMLSPPRVGSQALQPIAAAVAAFWACYAFIQSLDGAALLNLRVDATASGRSAEGQKSRFLRQVLFPVAKLVRWSFPRRQIRPG